MPALTLTYVDIALKIVFDIRGMLSLYRMASENWYVLLACIAAVYYASYMFVCLHSPSAE